MNKKHLSIIASLLSLSILIAGCDTGRDLSTPETRIVGHWGWDVVCWSSKMNGKT
jgi:hypothetical protein